MLYMIESAPKQSHRDIYNTLVIFVEAESPKQAVQIALQDREIVAVMNTGHFKRPKAELPTVGKVYTF